MKRLQPAKKEPLDRRVQRTRQLLREALVSLVLEKGYEATTVQDILDRANLGRSTFYTHYSDKDELLVSGFEHLQQMIEEFDSHIPAGNPHRPAQKYQPTLAFFEHAAEHHRFYKAMVGKQGGEIVQRYLYKYISHLAGSHLTHLTPRGKKTPVPQEVIVHYMVSSFLTLLTWWLNHDMPYTPEQMYEMYHVLTLPGINAGLGKNI
ncbi:TetR/AcrR family transcriptional regulator [bacterium]|nr:TetR/AcrR family transcriptional regulator [bacterium]MCI0606167.1 TetR/AcrR family transcriptional regulator [bacterium]